MKTWAYIAEALDMSQQNAQLIYNLALKKLKAHMRTKEDWMELLTLRTDTERVAEFLMAAIEAGALAEKGMTRPRHEQSTARRKFKMAYRRFMKGEK